MMLAIASSAAACGPRRLLRATIPQTIATIGCVPQESWTTTP
jgi:hypothetical protein